MYDILSRPAQQYVSRTDYLVICLVKQNGKTSAFDVSQCTQCSVYVRVAEMQREHQRREHRLQEAHCCALSTMEEARQHQIRVGNTSIMHTCGCAQFSLRFDMFAALAVCVSGCTTVQNIIHSEKVILCPILHPK